MPGEPKPHVQSLGPKARLTKTEAKQACVDLQAEHARNPAMASVGKAPTLGTWCPRYLELRTDLEQGTRTLHDETARYLKERFGEERRLDRITRRDAANWRNWLATKPGNRIAAIDEDGTKHRTKMSDASVCRHIRTAKVIFAEAVKLDLIAVNPFDRERGTPAEVEDWTSLDPATIATLIAKAPTTDWRLLLALCAYAGLRRGEAQRLMWDHVNIDRNRLTVVARKVTTKKRTRDVLIVPELAESCSLCRRHAAKDRLHA